MYKILILFCLVNIGTSSKILIWCPTPSISHQILYYPVVKELSLRGHQVTFITTNPMNNPSLINLTEMNVNASYNIYKNVNFASDDWGLYQYKMLINLFCKISDILEYELEDPAIINTIVNEKFDVFITETNFHPGLALLKQILKCPIINLATMFPDRMGYQLVGKFFHTSYEAHFLLPFSKPKTFYERMVSTYFAMWDWYLWKYNFIPRQINSLKKLFGDKIRNYNQELKVDLMLSNTHPILTGVTSNFPNVIEIGGINKPKLKGLPNDLKNFLDSSKNGVLYLSFGSNVKSNMLPQKTKQIIIETLKKLPFNVLWKFEEELVEKPNNVFIYKWLPQVDVLNHPNVKLFITQGGMQSLEESIHARVPIIGIPFMADQFKLIDHFTNNLKVGLQLNIKTITVDSFYKTILKIWNDKSFKERVNIVSETFKDTPIDPLDNAIYWVEYMIRHKSTKFLESPKLNMSLFEFLLLDVILFSLLIFILVLFSFYLILKMIKEYFFGTNKMKLE